MSNTSTVSQLPIAPMEAPGDRSRAPSRNGGGDGEGGFQDLVSNLRNLALARDRTGRGAKAPAEGPADALAAKVADWLRGNADLVESSLVAVDTDSATAENQALPVPQDGNVAQLLILAGVNDMASLVQAVANSGLLAEGDDAAAVIARFVNGNATEGDAALVRAAVAAAGNADAPAIPDAAMLATLAKATSQAEARRAGTPPPETIGKVAVLGQEVHFAPVSAAAAVTARPEWAAALAANSNRTAEQPTADAPTSIGAVASGGNPDPQVLNLHAAVTAVRDGRSNAHAHPQGSSSGGRQNGDAPVAKDVVPAADAGATTSSTAPDQSIPVAGADRLVSTGPPGGIAQQIAGRIAAEAGSPAQVARPELRTVGVAQSSSTPVKVMYIQLSPAELGTVTIRMSVKDNALQLDLEVGRGETAQLIQRERDTLSSLLRSAGYAIDAADVRMTSPGGAQPPAADNQNNMQMQGGQSRGSQPEGRSTGAGAQNDRRGGGFSHGHNGEGEPAGHRPRSGGLYV